MPSPHHSSPHPREGPDRCSLRSQLRGDPLAGTAFPASRLLLVEQPGPWGSAGLRESHFDATIAAELEVRTRASGVRLQAIRRPGRTPPDIVRRWALVDCRDGRESLRWGSFVDDKAMLDVSLDPDDAAGELDLDPLYLVCAHSRHDTCCAVRGRPVAAALHAVRPGRVWESSHLGGHRFAANVLVAPIGLLYGRVLPFAAAQFVAATEAGDVAAALLRGRVGLPPAAQAALVFGYQRLALRERSALKVVSTSPVEDEASIVRLAGPDGLLEVTVRVERVEADGLSCADPGPNSYLSYLPVSVVPAEPAS